jgi:glutamate racemase
VVQQACPALAGAIEAARPRAELEALVATAVAELCTRLESGAPDRALLGCTHFAIVEPLFRRELPARTRLLSQPDAIADSLEDYLARHPAYAEPDTTPSVRLLTTGAVAEATRTATIFWPGAPAFERL